MYEKAFETILKAKKSKARTEFELRKNFSGFYFGIGFNYFLTF